MCKCLIIWNISDECEKGVDFFTICRASTRLNLNRRRGVLFFFSFDLVNVMFFLLSYWSVC